MVVELVLSTPDGRAIDGRTENLSARGAMLSVPEDHGLRAEQAVTLALHAPDGTGLNDASVTGHVRWSSETLPEIVGVEFDGPLSPPWCAWLAAQGSVRQA